MSVNGDLKKEWLTAMVAEKKATIVNIPIEKIRPNPYQPRKIFDEVALQELAESIQKNGVFQPIIVRPSSVLGYELIAGERRFRASKLAKQATIPAIVRQFNEDEMVEIAILENLQREDLSPLEEAQAYEKLMKQLQLNQTQLAEHLGKSRPYIANYLRLLGLPQATKRLLQTGELSMAQARTLLSLQDKDKVNALAQKTVNEGLTVRNLTALVEQLNGQKNKVNKRKKVRDIAEPYYRQSEQLLGEKFGTKVTVNSSKKSGKGKIEIDYFSVADFNRILDVLHINLD